MFTPEEIKFILQLVQSEKSRYSMESATAFGQLVHQLGSSIEEKLLSPPKKD